MLHSEGVLELDSSATAKAGLHLRGRRRSSAQSGRHAEPDSSRRAVPTRLLITGSQQGRPKFIYPTVTPQGQTSCATFRVRRNARIMAADEGSLGTQWAMTLPRPVAGEPACSAGLQRRQPLANPGRAQPGPEDKHRAAGPRKLSTLGYEYHRPNPATSDALRPKIGAARDQSEILFLSVGGGKLLVRQLPSARSWGQGGCGSPPAVERAAPGLPHTGNRFRP